MIKEFRAPPGKMSATAIDRTRAPSSGPAESLPAVGQQE